MKKNKFIRSLLMGIFILNMSFSGIISSYANANENTISTKSDADVKAVDSKIIKELEDKIKKLDEESRRYEKEIKKLTDRKDISDMDIPEGVNLDQWYPEKIVKYPVRRKYEDGDLIDLRGMKIRFRRVYKENGEYKEETENIKYKDLKKEYKGWKFKLKTKKARYKDSDDGKLKIKIGFSLNDVDESYE